jgi:hypothetical protein
MSQNRAFLILMIAMFIAMLGGVFVYKKAFREDELTFKLVKIDVDASGKGNDLLIDIDSYIDVYSDSTLLKKDAEPHQKFLAKDSIVEVSFKANADSSEWTNIDPKVCNEEIDASTGSKTTSCTDASTWTRKFNRSRKSTLLKKEMMRFVAKNTSAMKIAVSITLQNGVVLIDTAVVIR